MLGSFKEFFLLREEDEEKLANKYDTPFESILNSLKEKAIKVAFSEDDKNKCELFVRKGLDRDNSGEISWKELEIELTPKAADKYIGILENYKDNIKFGKLFYLCGSLRIARYVKEAYKTIKGLGDCDLYLLPFTAPAQRLSNFSYEDEKSQELLLKETARSTTNGKDTK